MTSCTRFVARSLRLVMALAMMLSVVPIDVAAARPAIEARGTAPDRSAAAVPTATLNQLPQSAPQSSAPQAPDAVSFTATKRDALVVDIDGDMQTDPGDTLEYTVIITDSGTTDATGVQFNDTLDVNTTLVGGSLVASPVAVNDTYPQTVVGNVSVNSTLIPFSIVSNDYMGLNPAATITAYDATSANGGTVVVNADGTFTYDPPRGFEGTDTFNYTLSNSTGSSSGVVSIPVSGLVWFINNNAGACSASCDGRLSHPYTTLAAFNTANGLSGGVDPDTNDNIFIYESATAYSGAVTFRSGQKLIGQDSTQSLTTITGLTPPSSSPSFPAMNPGGNATTLQNGGGNAVTLNQNNTIRGLTISGTSGAGIIGTSISNLTVGADVSLTGVSGADLDLSGAAGGTVSFGASVTNSAGRAISIQNRNSGTVDLTGAVNDSGGTGILLNSNSGATITFSGGVSLSTGSNAAFTATNGGTVNVCDENPCNPAATGTLVNTLTTTTATALNVNATTIGVNNLEFRSISSSGGTATGIILNNTGATGALVVKGDGGTTRGGNSSGGTITNKTGGADGDGTGASGVYINGGSATLRNMTLTRFDNFGLYGLSVNNVTLQYSTVGAISGSACADADGDIGTSSGSADAAIAFGKSNPGGLNGFNNAGTALLDNLLVRCSIEHQIEIYQQSNGFSATISNSDVKDNSTAFGSDGILTEMQGTANGAINIQTVAFDDNKSQAVQGAANDNSILDITINQSTVTRSAQGNEGLVLSNGSNGRLIAHVTNNTITGIGGVSIFVGQTAGNANALAGGAVGLTAVIRGNTVTAPASATNSAIIAYLTSTVGQVSLANILIESNTIAQNSTTGVARPFLIDTPDNLTTPSWTATVLNNNVTFVDAGAGTTADVTARRGTGCFDVRGNVIAGPFGIRVRQASPATVQLEQGVSGSTVPATVLDDNHPAGTVTTVAGTVTVVGNSTCLTPPVAMLPDSNQVLAQTRSETVPMVIARVPIANADAANTFASASGSANPFKQTSWGNTSDTLNGAPVVFYTRASGRASNLFAGLQSPARSGETVNVSVGTLPAGKSITIKFRATINDPVPDGVTQVSNQGTVTADGGINALTDDPDTATPNDPTVTLLDIQADIQLLGKSDGGLTATPGQQFGYTLVYTNAGPQGAIATTITETVPANTTYTGSGWTCTPDNTAGSTCTLNVGIVSKDTGGSAIFTVTVVNPVPAGVTQLGNTASIGTSVVDPDPGNNTASDTTPIDAAPDLVLAKSDGDSSATPGGTLAYTLTYANAGNQGATGVVLTETVPANTTFTGSGWTCVPDNTAGSTCTANVGSVNGGGAGGSHTFVVTVINPVAAGVTQVSNTASVADDGSNGADPNTSDNSSTDTTPVIAAPDLAVTKIDGGVSATPGSTVIYTLTYSNMGDQGATGVTLSDTVPANASFNAGSSTAGWSCLPGNTAGSTCTLSHGALNSGGNGSVTFAVIVDSIIPAGVTQLTNTVTIDDDGSNGADPNTGNNSSTDTTPVTAAPDLTLTKSDGGVRGIPNGTVAYTLQFDNTGNQGATGVTLTDTVPANTSFNSSASSVGWSCADGASASTVCTLVVGGVIGGGTGSRLFAVTVDNPFPLIESAITNTATIADDGINGADATPANNLASDSTPIDTVPDLQITKTHTGNFTKGQVGATYTLHVSNVGGLPTTDTVTVTDALPIGLTATGLSGTGWSCDLGTLTCTRGDVLNASASYPDITLTVDVAPTAASIVTNTATVSGGGESNTANDMADDVTQLDKAASATALVAGPNPSVFGQSVTFTATVTAGVGAPTGIVTFTDGVITLGTGSLSGGVATFSTSSLVVGTHPITATYSGDADFIASNASMTQTVNQANSVTVLTSNPNPAVFGQSVTFTATVSASAPGAGTPTGVVTFTDGAVVLGSSSLNTGVATFGTSSLAVGAHSITATYDGDGNFNASSGAATQIIDRANSATTLTSAPNPSVFGQNVTFTATVIATAPGAGSPTGVVTFTDGATVLGTGNLNASGLATLSVSSLSVGVHTIVVTYAGDTDFTTSNGSTSQTVNQANTSTTLVSTSNPSVFGQAVTFTATVIASAPGSGTPTGSVTFFNNGASIGAGTLSGGVATFSTASLSVGTHPITVTYSGDTSFTVSTSSILNQVVDQAETSTALASAPNPSIYGQSVIFTATVSASAPGAGVPTGSITFFADGNPIGAGTLSGAAASVSYAALSVGDHAVTAQYNGDSNFNLSISGAMTHTVDKAETTTSITSEPNPSVVGQSIAITATIAANAPGAGVPGGTVTFYNNGVSLGSAAMSNGAASISTSSLAVGAQPITATYSGDASFNASSGAHTHTVDQPGTTTIVSAHAPQPSIFGQAATFTATVSVNAPGAGTPTGSITFFADGNSIGTGTLSGNSASISYAALTAGDHAITAHYGGDSSFVGSTSTAITHTVNKADTTTVITAQAPQPSIFGQAATFTSTVTTDAPGSGTPIGSVSFYADGTLIGTSGLSGGVATFNISALPAGDHAITATYFGGDNFATSTSGAITHTVNKADTTTTVAVAPEPSIFGQAATFTATVTTNAPGNGTPTGSITFTIDATSVNVPLDATGQAAYITDTLLVGTHAVSADYSGAANFNVSSGALSGDHTVIDTPIADVIALNSSPTRLSDTTFFTVTATGSNITYEWDFGDNTATAGGATASHVYAAAGAYTARVTATNGVSVVVATTPVSIVNLAPIANAGADQAQLVNAPVTLDGTASSDLDAHLPLAYLWQQTGGSSVTLSDAAISQPTFTTPAVPEVLTFTLIVTDAFGAGSLPDEVVVLVDDHAITDLNAVNDSPLIVGHTTHFTATIGAGSNALYAWDFGDGQTGSGAQTDHRYERAGFYTATVTATNGAGSISVTTVVTIEHMIVRLPLVMNRYASAPDLVVDQIIASGNDVQVVIKNRGDAPVLNEFWVDVYINPTQAPTGVNQTWPMLGEQGLTWGVTAGALPALKPGGVLTLTLNDAYYFADLSNVVWPLPAGTVLYAQADSADASTTYGAVHENHELVGLPYNNIRGPVTITLGSGVQWSPTRSAGGPITNHRLPRRP